jgi:hypothetical protein
MLAPTSGDNDTCTVVNVNVTWPWLLPTFALDLTNAPPANWDFSLVGLCPIKMSANEFLGKYPQRFHMGWAVGLASAWSSIN